MNSTPPRATVTDRHHQPERRVDATDAANHADPLYAPI
jgi:hypothetical protein